MKLFPSRRAARVRYAIRFVERFAQSRKAQGKDVIHLNVGDPAKYDFPVPAHIRSVATAALKNRNYYAPSAGIDEAREAVAQAYGVTKEQTFITSGVSEGIDILMNVLLNPKDVVLLPKPTYPLYTAACEASGLRHAFYPTNPETWEPELSPSRAKALVVINPNNPTGAVYGNKKLKEIVDFAIKHKLVLIADEIYDEIVFEDYTNLRKIVKDEAPLVTLNGLSKNFLAPGWRIGWMTLHNIDVNAITDAIQNLCEVRLCAPTPMQFAIKTALTGTRQHVAEMVRKLKKRRNLVYQRLNEIGLTCVKPRGAFYAFPKIPAKNDLKFVQQLCEKTGVLCVHGSGFGMPGYMRIVFLPQEPVLNEAMDRIETFVKRWK